MAEERKRLLKELLPFEALEAPKWRKTEDVPVKEMVAKIIEYSKEWEGQKKDNYESDLIEQVRQDFLVEFIFHVNIEEEKGFSTYEETDDFLKNCHDKDITSKSEQETLNVKKAYDHLLDKIKREERVCYKRPIAHYLKTSLSEMAARNLVYLVTKGGLPILKESGTNIHISQKLSRWKMPLPVCLMAAISDLICAPNIWNMVWKTLTTFTFYWKHVRGFYLNFLIFTHLRKYDYQKALYDTRNTDERHPTALTTMIIECSYHGWKHFFQRLEEKTRLRESK